MDLSARSTRSGPRLRRRLRVAFLGGISFTSDVGAGGFSTERLRVPAAGAPVEGTIAAEGAVMRFRGRVAWARAGDPALGLRGRMGVQFHGHPPELARLLAGCRIARAEPGHPSQACAPEW